MNNQTPSGPPPPPRCPRCQATDIEEEEQSGSSQRWYVCQRCGHQWSGPRRPPR